MSEAAKELEIDPATIDGLEEVFDLDSPTELSEADRTEQDQTTENSRSVQDGSPELKHPLSVEEAAQILGISSNAVCKRLRKGTLVGQKIPGKFKEEWLIEGVDIIEVLNVDFSTDGEDSPTELSEADRTEQDQTTENSGSVQDDPGSVQGGMAAVARLVDLVEKQAAKLEAASGQIGYLQARLESQTNLLETREAEIKLLTDSQSKAGWWLRFCSWFMGR